MISALADRWVVVSGQGQAGPEMPWNLADTGNEGTADRGAWETVEITPIGPVAPIRRQRAALAGGLLVLAAVVGVGLWPMDAPGPPVDAGDEQCPVTEPKPAGVGASPSIDVAPNANATRAPLAVATNPSIVVLMPAPEEVILGAVVAVAGRVEGVRPGPAGARASWIHVVIVAGDAMLGEADLRVVGQSFIGWVPVDAPARGQVADVRFSDGRRPDRILFEQEVVLGPGG